MTEGTMDRKPIGRAVVPVALALIIAGVIVLGARRLGVATMVIIGGSAVIAYFVWLATAWRRPVDPSRVLSPYLVLIAMELIHMGEEQVSDFPSSLRQIFDIPPTFDLLTHALVLMGGVNALAILAAVGLRSRHRVAQQFSGYMVWFYVIGPGVVNAVAHVTFPFLVGRLYFSGLVTVILPTVAGVVTLVRLIQGDIA
ncbi:MAG TPA: hypothetical protein VMN77_08655, partial [Nitrospiria bacterium]|nr:hypothetical protein [Nitrospiria bacterium]